MSEQQNIKLSTVLLLIGSLCLCLGNTLAAAGTSKNEVSSRIVGGTPISGSAVPYIVSLRKDGQFSCGGTLVTPTHVVTAAHCTDGTSANRLTVTGGITYLTEAGVRRGVAQIFQPNTFDMVVLNTDVAVLKLTAPMTGPNISTAPLCTASLRVGNLFQVSGWGLTIENGAGPSTQLRTVAVPLISAQSCKAQYPEKVLYPSMICASVPGVKDSCSGDSGGPAIFQGQLCGIVSWGIGCGRQNRPGVYTNVNQVKAFIENAIRS